MAHDADLGEWGVVERLESDSAAAFS